MSLPLVVLGRSPTGAACRLSVRDGLLGRADAVPPGALRIDWDEGVLLPGFTNAHDHLAFNLFPRLGRPPYASYREWMTEVYRPEEPTIAEVRALPIGDRLLWGGYRNLFCGATTVVHHDPWHPSLADPGFPVRVVPIRWAHSLAVEADVAARAAEGNPAAPFFVHAAEGVDEESRAEIDELGRRGLLAPGSWLVHALAATPAQARRLGEAGAGVVWCPSSNLFLYGRTLDAAILSSGSPVLLGTDSLATGDGDLLDEMRVAARSGAASREEILEMVTTRGAQRLLPPGAAPRLAGPEPAGVADFVLLRGDDPFVASRLQVALVLREGRPAFGEPRFEPLFRRAGVAFDRIRLDGEERLVVAGFAGLLERTKRHLPGRELFLGARIEAA